MSVPPLSFHDATVQFHGLRAVDGVTVDVPRGITAVIGPNGAGKTTLFNAVTGYVPLTSGEIRIYGETPRKADPVVLRRDGVSRTFQHLELFGGMTVRGNILAGLHTTLRYGVLSAAVRGPGRRAQERRVAAEAVELATRFELADVLDQEAANLPYGRKKLVAIARALAGGARLLLLDEPAAGLNDAEIARIAALLRRLVAEEELDIVLVEHNMRLVSMLADHVIALDMGRVLTRGTADEVLSSPAVVDAYLGAGSHD